MIYETSGCESNTGELGIFTTHANGAGAVVGAICGAAGLYWVQEYTQVHLLLYATVGIALCVVTGYLSSFIFPRPLGPLMD